ncbi:uridine kinase [Rhizoclosmatium globosum]|uniref:Uridine kinase n=1 Tax=Rhizoclosmatium globosum TaxID=329046 RepID=A0A1Y2CHR1_9FUNG|nr:uridine kinase [Rhizoclosmatium globosum]|eukprot:ORY46569.1 uridine kinase [Rhizoclosmatium globosum]
MGDSGGGITDGDHKLPRGRFPWFSVDGKTHKPYMIGIGGGSASGKTSVANHIIKKLGVPWVVLLQMDSFYKSLSKAEIEQAYANNYNFDHPNSFDFDVLFETLKNLKSGVKVDVPIYDFGTHSRANIIIFEGIFALYDPKVRDLMDLMLFVDTDSDVRLARRLKRDIAERGRDIHGVLQQYKKYVKPAFDDYILPTMKHADVIVPRGSDNVAAINVIMQHITRELDARDLSLRSQLLQLRYPAQKPDSVVVLESNPEVHAMLQTLEEKGVSREDFEFMVDRLSRLVVERGLLEFEKVNPSMMETTNVLKLHEKIKGTNYAPWLDASHQQTPTWNCHACQPINSRSPSPSGHSDETAATQLVNDVAEIELHHCRLPRDIRDRVVIITDVTTSTGAAAMMAVRIVLDHGVEEKNIIFLSLVATSHGLHVLANAFPEVKIVVAHVVSEIYPGIRQIEEIRHFGDRSFTDLISP